MKLVALLSILVGVAFAIPGIPPTPLEKSSIGKTSSKKVTFSKPQSTLEPTSTLPKPTKTPKEPKIPKSESDKESAMRKKRTSLKNLEKNLANTNRLDELERLVAELDDSIKIKNDDGNQIDAKNAKNAKKAELEAMLQEFNKFIRKNYAKVADQRTFASKSELELKAEIKLLHFLSWLKQKYQVKSMRKLLQNVLNEVMK